MQWSPRSPQSRRLGKVAMTPTVHETTPRSRGTEPQYNTMTSILKTGAVCSQPLPLLWQYEVRCIHRVYFLPSFGITSRRYFLGPARPGPSFPGVQYRYKQERLVCLPHASLFPTGNTDSTLVPLHSALFNTTTTWQPIHALSSTTSNRYQHKHPATMKPFTIAALTTLASTAAAQRSFYLMALRSASPIHFGAINANASGLWIGKESADYCPDIDGLRNSCPNSTSAIFGISQDGVQSNTTGNLYLDVIVPGGQQM